jgi:hypothetical protein
MASRWDAMTDLERERLARRHVDQALLDAMRARDELAERLQTCEVKLGWALFNQSKGKHDAATTLMRKAYHAAAGEEWGG